jgi:small-conductance mechanosensitive channel
VKNVWQWYDQYSDVLLSIAGHVLQILLFFILARILIRITISAVNRLIKLQTVKMDERRRNTLLSLLDNMIRYTIYFIFAVEALSSLNIHVETLLAGAGIAGLALGFGAQSLIKDVLTGFFIIFEDQYGVGDLVKINQFTGTVISIGLRLTRIQAWTGEIEIIPNGQITQVTNYSKANSIAVVDVGVSYQTDLNRAMEVIQETMQQLKAENENIVGDVQILGVQSLGKSDVVIRVTAECKPTTHFAVQRQAYQRIKEAFDREQIDIPYTQQVILTHPVPTNPGTSN